jgi:hypothetical protein
VGSEEKLKGVLTLDFEAMGVFFSADYTPTPKDISRRTGILFPSHSGTVE